MIALDASWRSAHPLPVPTGETDKNSRGQLLVIGGARRVPGAVALTAEAALRVGAGKVRVATIADAAIGLGIAMPEIGVIGLPEDDGGNIAARDDAALFATLARVDAIVVGPGMGDRRAAAALIRLIVPRVQAEAVVVLDGAAVAGAGALDDVLAPLRDRLILTPHAGEMAALLDGSGAAAVNDDSAQVAADRFGAAVALKGTHTVIAAPGAAPIRYPGGGVGLATGGSGDVLAGVIGGLAARGTEPSIAAAWGVWLHGEAGRALAQRSGPIGFLSRELPPLLPALLPR